MAAFLKRKYFRGMGGTEVPRLGSTEGTRNITYYISIKHSLKS